MDEFHLAASVYCACWLHLIGLLGHLKLMLFLTVTSQNACCENPRGSDTLNNLIHLGLVFPQICNQASVVPATASLQSVLSQQGRQEGHHSWDSGGAEKEGKSHPNPKRQIMERNKNNNILHGIKKVFYFNLLNT